MKITNFKSLSILGITTLFCLSFLPLSVKAVDCKVASGLSLNDSCVASFDPRFCKTETDGGGTNHYSYDAAEHGLTCSQQSQSGDCDGQEINGSKLCTWEAPLPVPSAPGGPVAPSPGAGGTAGGAASDEVKPDAADSITSQYLEAKYPVPDGYTGAGAILEKCAFAGTCRSTDDLLILVLNTMDFLFSIIGVVAFVAFIYGGFMMIFSFGSSEKVGHGKDAMVAAVVGLVIAFGAYMLINFILKALGVEADFRGITD